MTPKWRALPSQDPPEPRRLRESLDGFARRLGVPRAASLGRVFSGWEAIVGEAMAAHASPLSLRDGVLVVAVDDPAWATQIRWLSSDLVERINAEAGPDLVTRVEVRVKGAR